MFVTSEGTSMRPPIQLTANLYRIIHSSPYIIGNIPNKIYFFIHTTNFLGAELKIGENTMNCTIY